jgi:hypothetical protein
MHSIRSILEGIGVMRFAVFLWSAVGCLPQDLYGVWPMDFLVSPAALIAVMNGVALAAWAVGRWQGGAQLLPAETSAPLSWRRNPSAAQVVTPLPREQISRAHALESVISLADLHEEISAFRQRERVFATLAPDALFLDRLPAAQQTECRRNNGVAAPTWAAHEASDGFCTCGDCGGLFRTGTLMQIKADQPSPGWTSLTRM